jgi:hypothetical protein
MGERLAVLLNKMALHRIRRSDKKAFGQNILPNTKSRVLNILELIHGPHHATFYTREQKAYLTGANRPVETLSINYKNWMEILWKICVSVELKFIYKLVQDFNNCVPAYIIHIGKDAKSMPQTRSFNPGKAADGKPLVAIKGKTVQTKDVGSVASAAEKLKTMKNALKKK